MPARKRPQRAVVKIGTSSLVSAGAPDLAQLAILADAVAQLRVAGQQPVLVGSGAIQLGWSRLRASGLGSEALARQEAAAVGQGVLFEAFRHALAERGLTASQVLLTPLDLTSPAHSSSVCSGLARSLDAGLVPVVNENDAIMVRNNDVLAALLAAAIGATRLVLLTDVPGFYDSDPRRSTYARLIPEISAMSPDLEQQAGTTTGVGTGGMASKLCATWIATMAGVTTVIARATSVETVRRAVQGVGVGTLIHSRTADKKPDLSRLWHALSVPPSGQIHCSSEALATVVDGGPLTARYLRGCTGEFTAGDVVDVTVGSQVIARGRTQLSHDTWTERGTDPILIHHTEYVSFLEV
jgi:glutamate 5-kinase